VILNIEGAFVVMIPIITPQIIERFKQTEVAQSDVKVVLICFNAPGWLCYSTISILVVTHQITQEHLQIHYSVFDGHQGEISS